MQLTPRRRTAPHDLALAAELLREAVSGGASRRGATAHDDLKRSLQNAVDPPESESMLLPSPDSAASHIHHECGELGPLAAACLPHSRARMSCFIDFATGDATAYTDATARYDSLREWLTANAASYGLARSLDELDAVGQETLAEVYASTTRVRRSLDTLSDAVLTHSRT